MSEHRTTVRVVDAVTQRITSCARRRVTISAVPPPLVTVKVEVLTYEQSRAYPGTWPPEAEGSLVVAGRGAKALARRLVRERFSVTVHPGRTAAGADIVLCVGGAARAAKRGGFEVTFSRGAIMHGGPV